MGDAITFGPGDMMSASEVGLPTGNADRSMVLWVWMENAPSNEAIFAGYGNPGGYEESYILGSTGLAPFFSQWGSAVVGPALSLRQWHQVAVTSVGDRAVLYVDGAVAEAGELPIHTVAGTGIYPGTFPGELAAGRAFEGKLDEVMIWDRALRGEEIAELYAIGADGTCP